MEIDRFVNDRPWFERFFRDFQRYGSERMCSYGDPSGKPHGQAASFESFVCFASYVDNPEGLVVDAGAGASSFVLRRWFPNVVTTDPDAEYLEAVRRTCEGAGIGGQPESWVVGIRSLPVHDYLFWDYGTRERFPALPAAFEKTRIFAYCDDADTRQECTPLRTDIRLWSEASGLTAIDCPQAIDEYGRWGVLVRR